VSDGYVWLSYLATYGMIVGYIAAMVGRVGRSKRGS
jgi:hypothetical protein